MNLVARLADRVILTWGWPRRLIALAAGAVSVLAMPPLGFWPVLLLTLPVAVWLIDGSTGDAPYVRVTAPLSAAGAGWWFGFGFHLAGLWWLGAAFLVEADEFAWLMPLGVVGLPAVLALFHAFGFALARALWSDGPRRLFAFAAALSIAEWLRGHVLTGFPWNALGMAFGADELLAQGASVVGLYGLTLLAFLLLSTPAALGTARGRAAWWPPVAAAVVLALLAGAGAWRLGQAPATGDEAGLVPRVRLRIMQPNLAQDAKFRPAARDEIMGRYLALSDRATSPSTSGVADATHLIWPESPFPFVLSRDQRALAAIAALLPPGVTLVTGAVRSEEPLPGEQSRRYYNSIHVIGHDGTILDTADKVHLVPFGEYLPFRDLLDRLGLRQFVHVPGGFDAAERHRSLIVPGLPAVAPLICYEAIFPGDVVPPGTRPGLLLNLTNDGWFGMTPGPWQHLAQARLRAIEEGLPLVRAANTGISAVTDPYGRVLARTDLGEETVLDARLPRAIGATIYARFGDALFWLLIVMSTLVATISRRSERFLKREPCIISHRNHG